MNLSLVDFSGALLGSRFRDYETGNIWRFDCVSDLFFIEGHDMRLSEADSDGYFYVLILVAFYSRSRSNKTHYPDSYECLQPFELKHVSKDLVDDDGELDALIKEMQALIKERTSDHVKVSLTAS